MARQSESGPFAQGLVDQVVLGHSPCWLEPSWGARGKNLGHRGVGAVTQVRAAAGWDRARWRRGREVFCWWQY